MKIEVNGEVISIEDLYMRFMSKKEERLITPSLTEDCSKTDQKLIVEVIMREVDEEIIDFYTENGVFSCTEDHLIPVKRDHRIILMKAKNILDTDELIMKGK